MMSDFTTVQDNVIEFLKNEDTATVTFSQGRYITKIKKLAEKYPEECEIVAENKDGSIMAHIPVKWILISNRSRDLSEEERQVIADRLRNTREQGRNNPKINSNPLEDK